MCRIALVDHARKHLSTESREFRCEYLSVITVKSLHLLFMRNQIDDRSQAAPESS